MKVNKGICFHILVFVFLFLINFSTIFNLATFHGFAYGDSEVAAFIAYLLNNGSKLYQDFSIVYGPGRFISLAFINKLFGVNISVPLFYSYSVLIARVLVPWAIYWVTYKLLNKDNKYLSLVLGLVAAIIYSLILRSGQDTHLVILLFIGFYSWSKQNNNKIISVLAGILLGLIGFFRIESGIFALIAVGITEFINYKKDKNNSPFYISYLIFQVGYFLLILINGSLPNFFHDVFLMGVLAQPKIMKIIIKPVDYPLFEFFMILNIFSVLIAKRDKNKAFLCLAIMSLLGFANALGRADFDHLYYGIVLLIPIITIAFYKLIISWESIKKEKISIKVFGLTVLLIGLEVFTVKRQIPLLLLVLLFCILIGNKWIKKGIGLISIVMVIVAFQVMVRSQSLFTFYFKRQLEVPRIKNINSGFKQMPLYLEEVKNSNYGGYQLDKTNSQTLEQMRKDLGDKTLFVYPSHASLYQALGKQAPIRYLYFNNEYTQKMEEETIEMLLKEKIEYVLVSNNLTRADAIVPNQTQKIWQFINKNYIKEKEYLFGNDKMMLMKINESL
ncbi:MAG: hypothetical protein WDA13_00100 [Candidatus Shapirobacteria bacterium]